MRNARRNISSYGKIRIEVIFSLAESIFDPKIRLLTI